MPFLQIFLSGCIGVWLSIGTPLWAYGETERNIRLEIKSRTLEDLFESFADATKAEILMKETLKNRKAAPFLIKDLRRKTFPAFLENFNRITVNYGEDRPQKIYILSVRNPGTAESVLPLSSGPVEKTSIPLENPLSREQYRKIAQGTFKNRASIQLFENPETRAFLSMHGVDSKRDLKDPKKALKVRVEALRQLKFLKNQEVPTQTTDHPE